jgi:sugar phosphate isomerase/epimerase
MDELVHTCVPFGSFRQSRARIMLPQFSLAHLTVLGLSPPEMVEVAAQAGYSFVGLRLNAVTATEPKYALHEDARLLQATKRALTASGVQVLDVELIRITPAFDVHDYDALLDVSAELGARHLIVQGADAELARVIEHYGLLCDSAAQRNLTADIEFVTWTETPTLSRASQIVAGVRRGNAGLLVDTLHFSRSSCELQELANLPRAWFNYAQVCDAPAEPPTTVDELIHAARNERLFLGNGGLDVRGILDTLPPGIPCSLEIPNTNLAKRVGLPEFARLALSTARDFFAAGSRGSAASASHRLRSSAAAPGSNSDR